MLFIHLYIVFKVDRPLANYIKSALPLLRSFDETGKTVEERFVIHPQLYYCGRFDAIIKYKYVFICKALFHS